MSPVDESPSLNKDASRTVDLTVNAPAVPGLYYVYLSLDDDGNVNEWNENNNIHIVWADRILIGDPPTPTPTPTNTPTLLPGVTPSPTPTATATHTPTATPTLGQSGPDLLILNGPTLLGSLNLPYTGGTVDVTFSEINNGIGDLFGSIAWSHANTFVLNPRYNHGERRRHSTEPIRQRAVNDKRNDSRRYGYSKHPQPNGNVLSVYLARLQSRGDGVE